MTTVSRRARQDPAVALFARIPAGDAARLDRAAFALGLPKQRLVAALVARHVDPDSPSGLADLDALTAADADRVVIESGADRPGVGRYAFTPAPEAEVLTLAEAAAFLKLDEAIVAVAAAAGELPARRIEEHWRFGRAALLRWLAADP